MPDRTKRASLTQEAVRILRNCSEDIPWTRRAEFLSDLCLRMKMSGYGERYRQTIIQSALKAWDRMLEADRSGARPLYRDSAWLKQHRQEETKKKSSWYKGLGGQVSDFPIFCPASPGGRLAERWRRVAEEVRASSGGLVRATVVEQPGMPLSALLVDSMPGETDLCAKPDCNPCRSGTTRRQSCHRSSLGGMVYHCVCRTCQARGEDGGPLLSYYHGRTGRCLYTRQKEHIDGLVAKKEDNALWKHKELFHGEEEEFEYGFTAEKFFKDAMSHQIYEGISINRSPSSPGYLMNSRAEYDQGQVARLVVAQGL
jgi:hypothetical protein